MGNLLIYTSGTNEEIEVRLEGDTIWLTQKQIAQLFGTQSPAINKHIKNILKTGELEASATISILEIVQNEGKRKVSRALEAYNLDMILSIGYRVNSQQATHFRIWATGLLKEHLINGYTVNEKRLLAITDNLVLLQQIVARLHSLGNTEQIQVDEAKGIIDIINSYTRTFVLLNRYDSDALDELKATQAVTYIIQQVEALSAIAQLKQKLVNESEASNLFGNRKDENFESILGSIVQTFDGELLYPSIEEQAAHLLYFIIKNHPFTDGNKRIGAFLFIWFLDKNKHRLKPDGEIKINDNALTALALLVAESPPNEKEIMIKLIIHLITNA